MRFREISHKSIFAVAAEGPKRNRYQLPVPVFKPRIRVNKLNPFLGKIINPRVIGGVVLCSRNIYSSILLPCQGTNPSANSPNPHSHSLTLTISEALKYIYSPSANTIIHRDPTTHPPYLSVGRSKSRNHVLHSLWIGRFRNGRGK